MSSFRRFIQFAAVVGLLLGASVLRAAPWAVVADSDLGRIAMLDFGTTTPTVYGPFLQGQLGSTNGNSLCDVAITPDGQSALLSHFWDLAIYRVDISNPTNPVVTGCITNISNPEDIAMAPNGQFALVTYPYTGNADKLGIIDLSSFSTSITYTITSGAAQAVTIAPDNQTVILCDRDGHQIIYGVIGPTGLVSESVLSVGANDPINVAVAPDRKTVLVASTNTDVINVFQILSPGNVVTGETPTVSTMPGLVSLSIAFSTTTNRAYVLQKGILTNMLSWLQINSPGNVTLGGAGAATLLSKADVGVLAGVDTLAVSPDGAWALAGNPAGGDITNVLSLVNLSTFAVSPLNAYLQNPSGVSFARTPGFNTQVTTSPTNPAPLVLSTVTCLITVTNTGYQALNPFRLNLTFDPDYLAYAGGTPTADAAGTHMLIWSNVGPVAISSGTVVTAQFTALRQTLPDTMITVTSTARTAFGLLLAPQSSSVPVIIASSVLADFDGDRFADPFCTLKSNARGMWTLWLSSGGYLPWGPYIFTVPGGVSVTGDFDGDGISDPVMVANGGWTLWLSSGGYLPWGPYIFTVPGGVPLTGDFDGDGLADPAMVANGGWTLWLSSGGYLPWGPYIFTVPGGVPLTGDFDGDGIADPVMVANGGWTLWLSSGGYLPSGPYIFTVLGGNATPMASDFDGDGYADPVMIVNNNWTFWFSSGGYLPSGPYLFNP